MDVLEHLTQEHREVEAMLTQLKSTDPGPQRDQIVDKLITALLKHMDVEEKFLYPIVVDTMGEEPEQEAETEHDLTREGLTKLDALRNEPGFGAVVDMIEAGIAHHVKEEESEVFPKLRQKASAKLAEMDPQRMMAAVEVLDLSREDLYARAKQVGIPGRSNMSKEELAEAVMAASQ